MDDEPFLPLSLPRRETVLVSAGRLIWRILSEPQIYRMWVIWFVAIAFGIFRFREIAMESHHWWAWLF